MCAGVPAGGKRLTSISASPAAEGAVPAASLLLAPGGGAGGSSGCGGGGGSACCPADMIPAADNALPAPGPEPGWLRAEGEGGGRPGACVRACEGVLGG